MGQQHTSRGSGSQRWYEFGILQQRNWFPWILLVFHTIITRIFTGHQNKKLHFYGWNWFRKHLASTWLFIRKPYSYLIQNILRKIGLHFGRRHLFKAIEFLLQRQSRVCEQTLTYSGNSETQTLTQLTNWCCKIPIMQNAESEDLSFHIANLMWKVTLHWCLRNMGLHYWGQHLMINFEILATSGRFVLLDTFVRAWVLVTYLE